MSLKLKYFAGWISTNTMINKGWCFAWFSKAKEQEENNYQLVVFRIPKDNVEIIEEIENFLQTTLDK